MAVVVLVAMVLVVAVLVIFATGTRDVCCDSSGGSESGDGVSRDRNS
jgi:hypothetical protein